MTRLPPGASTPPQAALAEAGVGSPRADAELLAAHAAGTDRGRLAFARHRTRSSATATTRLVAQRAKRVPLQHLTGTAAFGPVTVQVGPGVFIPRPETESLLEWAVAQRLLAAPVDRRPVHGLGCAGRSRCRSTGPTPASSPSTTPRTRSPTPDATSQDTRVELVQADVTAAGLLAELDGQVDLVVANPPYIPDGAALEPEVAEHDPPHALFGGPDGMAVIDRIVDAGRPAVA